MMMATDEEEVSSREANDMEQEQPPEDTMSCNIPSSSANQQQPLVVDEEQPAMMGPEEEPPPPAEPTPEEEFIVFVQEDTSVFEGYSTQGLEEEDSDSTTTVGQELPLLDGTPNLEGSSPTDLLHLLGNTTTTITNSDETEQNNNNNEERDPELGLPLADLDSDNEEEDEAAANNTDENDVTTTRRRSGSTLRRRTFYWARFVLHIVFFPVLVITSVAIPVLIVMFCFALMFVAMVVLLCVYYCCSPRRGDQAAVPFHVLIRQILEAVEDETGGLGDAGNDAPKHSREEIQNSLVRRKLVDFECADEDGNVIPDPEPTDEATREERMHQDMFPVVAELAQSPMLAANALAEEEEQPKPTGLQAFRKMFSRKRKQKSQKNVEVVDHNATYELRMAQQNIKFTTDPAASNSKLFLVKRSFVFSPPLGPAKAKKSWTDDEDSSSDNDDDDNNDDDNNNAIDQETRNYNLAVAALEDSLSSSSSSSRFLQMLASSSSSDSSDSSSTASGARVDQATADSSDVSFLSEASNIVSPTAEQQPNNPTRNNLQETDNTMRNNEDGAQEATTPSDPSTGDVSARQPHTSEVELNTEPAPTSETLSDVSTRQSHTSEVEPNTEPGLTSETLSSPTSESSLKMVSQSEHSSIQQPDSDVFISPCNSTEDVLHSDLDAVLEIAFPAATEDDKDIVDDPAGEETAEETSTVNSPLDPAIESFERIEEGGPDPVVASSDRDEENANNGTEVAEQPVVPSSDKDCTSNKSANNGMEEGTSASTQALVDLTSSQPQPTSESSDATSSSQTTNPTAALLVDNDEADRDNQLAFGPRPEGDLAEAVSDKPSDDNELAKDGRNSSPLMIHPAFLPLEETKMEITSDDEPAEEPKTEIVLFDAGEPSEETKTEIAEYVAESHSPSPGLTGTESATDGPAPMEVEMTVLPTENTPATNDSALEPEPTSMPQSNAQTGAEQPEHRGISSYCTICLLEYEVGDVVVWSRRPHGCHHAFHQDCLLDWLQRKPTCPNCRQEFFSIEDAPPQPETLPAQDDNDNSLVDGNASQSTPSESRRSRGRFW